MPLVPKTGLVLALGMLAAAAAPAQQRLPTPPLSALPAPPYAEYADLVVAAPVIVDGAVRSELRLKPVDAPGVPPGRARMYLEADVVALIRGDGAVSTRIGYTIDVALDSRGRTPRFKNLRVLLFARPVRGTVGQVQLVRPDAQRAWTSGGEALTRRIVREVVQGDAPPVVTGVGNAFHTVGNLPGESETQVFLTTADNRPISFSIVRRPGAAPRPSIALGEVVGDGTPPPPRDTLLWYRIACALPPLLPEAALTSNGPDAAAAREDYALVMRTLGPCDRGGAL